MDFESYDCFDVGRNSAFLIINLNGANKTYKNSMDRVGYTAKMT